MSKNAEGTPASSPGVFYTPSWIDRFVDWLDRLPGPAWVYYVLGTLAFAMLVNGMLWIDGSLAFGAVDRLSTSFAVLLFYWLALYHYLTRVASRVLQDFRSLLNAPDPEISRIGHELTILPRWQGWLAVALGLVFSTLMVLGDPQNFGDLAPRTIIPYLVDIAATGFLFFTFLCLIIRTFRQLRMVHTLHERVTNINLLNLAPAHAFSALTARTGIGLIFLLIIGFMIDPSGFNSAVDIVDVITTGTAIALAVVAFVLPVIGIRGKLEAEKRRVLDEANTLLQTATDRLHDLVRGGDYRDAGDLREAIEALKSEREMVRRISTWPWDTATLRGFTSALLLPIIIWLVTRLLEELI